MTRSDVIAILDKQIRTEQENCRKFYELNPAADNLRNVQSQAMIGALTHTMFLIPKQVDHA